MSLGATIKIEPISKYVNFNCSDNKSYLSQRNNIITSSWTCNTTSMCMGIYYMGYDFPTGTYEQPEDNLTWFCQNDTEALKYFETNYPTDYQNWLENPNDNAAPNEYHSVLNYDTNLWMQREITYWNGSTTIADIVGDLREGKPVVLSALFGTLNHIICAVGIKYLSSDVYFLNPKRLIYDDPWGMTYNYDNEPYTGDNMELQWDNFISTIKPVNSQTKWAHRFY